MISGEIIWTGGIMVYNNMVSPLQLTMVVISMALYKNDVTPVR